LTIDLGENPKKIVALVGPNGCGKSSIFDAFEGKMKVFRSFDNEGESFYSKAFYYSDLTKRNIKYNRDDSVHIIFESGNLTRISFYIRTSYRYTSKFNVTQIQSLPSIFNTADEPGSSISLDKRLESNYKRIYGKTLEEFHNGIRNGNEVIKDLLGPINSILNNILDIEISDLGDICGGKGQFYFKKSNVINFPYDNLSSGEKEVVDIIIDLIIKKREFNDTIFCIDEPELHIHTAIQRKLLIEIDKLIPDNCQLWVATHSLGFLRALQNELKDRSQILDFSKQDYFTGSQIISPIIPTRVEWKRIFATALDDLTDLISPKRIIYCEGKVTPGKNGEEQGLDAVVYNNIFSEKYTDTIFVSSGGNTELDQRSDIAIAILNKVFRTTEILVLKDRDISSGKLNTENDRQIYLQSNSPNHRVLKRWEIENYLFDKEVLKKYCDLNCLDFNEKDYDIFVTNIEDNNLKDETGRIKNFCNLRVSINAEQFKINLSKLITPSMKVYSELEKCIFQRE